MIMGKIITAFVLLNLFIVDCWAQNQNITYLHPAVTIQNNATTWFDSNLQSKNPILAQNRQAPRRNNAPESQGKMSSESGGAFSVMIIGSGAPNYNPDRSGPSALVRQGNLKFLVDMGNGTQARLNEAGIRPRQLNALLFTHHHLDHNEEFAPIFISVLLGGQPFLIAGPEKTRAYVQAITSLYDEDIAYRLKRGNRTFDEVKGNYKIKELKGGEQFSHEGITISTVKVNHTIYTIAYRFDMDGKSIVISGDVAYSPSLPELAKDADVLVIDSGGVIKKSNGNRRRRPPGGGQAGQKPIRAHSNLDEIARMAMTANVKKLVLTHLTPGEVDEVATKEAISKQFKGEVIFGHDLMAVSP
jgi:ribonuclease BN (tRNA processing enzyme)